MACPITSWWGHSQTCHSCIDLFHLLLSGLVPDWYWHDFLHFLAQLCLDITEADTLFGFSSTAYAVLKDKVLNVCLPKTTLSLIHPNLFKLPLLFQLPFLSSHLVFFHGAFPVSVQFPKKVRNGFKFKLLDFQSLCDSLKTLSVFKTLSL